MCARHPTCAIQQTNLPNCFSVQFFNDTTVYRPPLASQRISHPVDFAALPCTHVQLPVAVRSATWRHLHINVLCPASVRQLRWGWCGCQCFVRLHSALWLYH